MWYQERNELKKLRHGCKTIDEVGDITYKMESTAAELNSVFPWEDGECGTVLGEGTHGTTS